MQKNQENASRVCENALFAALNNDFGDVCVRVFDELDSTNTEAKRMVRGGFCGDALLVAHTQTAGRGRMGRSFYSPRATGAYFSILHTLNTPLCDAVAITSAAAVSVMRAIRSLTEIQTEIKWVNDLYYNERKVCGILTEAVSAGDSTHLIVGIGINLNTTDFPVEIADTAGSLKSDRLDISALIADVYRELFRYLNDPSDREWLADYRRYSCVIGRKVAWTEEGITRIGVAESIDEDGALLVRDEKNDLVRLHTGEISVRPIQDKN